MYHYIKDLIKAEVIKPKDVATDVNIADVLTKGVSNQKHLWCCQKLSLCEKYPDKAVQAQK
jgi:hypothetical protein